MIQLTQDADLSSLPTGGAIFPREVVKGSNWIIRPALLDQLHALIDDMSEGHAPCKETVELSLLALERLGLGVARLPAGVIFPEAHEFETQAGRQR